MITAWTHHLKDEEKEIYAKSLRNSKWVLERLNDLLTDIDKGLDRQEISPSAYDSPNWAYKQAHLNGYRQCLSKIKTLINLDQKEQLSHDREPTRRQQPGRPPTS